MKTVDALALGMLLLQGCRGDTGTGPPRVALVEVSPAASTLTALGETRQLSAVPKDAAGNPMSGFTITWTSSRQSVAKVDDSGLVTAVGNGDAEITAAAASVPGRAQVVVRQQIARLLFVVQPSDALAGEAITPAIAAELQDPGGHRVTDAAVPVTLTLSANPGGATLGGTRTVTSSGGVATFNDVWLDKVASGYTLTAAAADLTPANSTAFAVAPGPVQLGFLTQPGTVEGQVPFDPAIQIRAGEDRFGNPVTDAPVTLTLAVNPSGETLHGTTRVTAVNGVATFGSLSLAQPGEGFVLEATSGAATPARSAEFSVRLTLVQVSAGAEYTCGVTVVAFAYCWGANVAGQLGDGTTDQRVIPTPVGGSLTFVRVSASAEDTCGVTTDNAAYCWGANAEGELGNGTLAQRFTPTPVVGGLRFVDVSVGSLHSCGITTDHVAYCWGGNPEGQLGDGTGLRRRLRRFASPSPSPSSLSPGGAVGVPRPTWNRGKPGDLGSRHPRGAPGRVREHGDDRIFGGHDCARGESHWGNPLGYDDRPCGERHRDIQRPESGTSRQWVRAPSSECGPASGCQRRVLGAIDVRAGERGGRAQLWRHRCRVRLLLGYQR